MPEIGAIIRRFERFLNNHGSYYSNCTEVRPDTKGALPEEITNYPVQRLDVNNEDVIPIAKIRYNFEKKTEKVFTYKSRGRK
jgi:hypothetical protein